MDGNPGPFEEKEPIKEKTKFYETTPFWMLIAAVIAVVICSAVFASKFESYRANNPSDIDMDLIHELVGDVFTAHQWDVIDLANEGDRIEVSKYLGGTSYRVNVHGPFLSGQEVATIIIHWSSYEKEYSLYSAEWKLGCTCGCDICEEECA